MTITLTKTAAGHSAAHDHGLAPVGSPMGLMDPARAGWGRLPHDPTPPTQDVSPTSAAASSFRAALPDTGGVHSTPAGSPLPVSQPSRAAPFRVAGSYGAALDAGPGRQGQVRPGPVDLKRHAGKAVKRVSTCEDCGARFIRSKGGGMTCLRCIQLAAYWEVA